jgi:hypothetical protein
MTTEHIHPNRKVPRAMGASRDFTTGTPTGATGVLERDRASDHRREAEPAGVNARTTAPTRPGRTDVVPGTERTDTPGRSPRRLGSRQVVSVRGRRVAPVKKASSLARVSVVAIVMLISGVALAMWLSGLATQQTFRLQQLSSQDAQLSNQLETLHRDLENVSSSAEVARRASDMGMVAPQQPGILEAGQPGEVEELRPAGAETSPIIDVNGAPVRPGQASSDPDRTDELADSLATVPDNQAPAPAPPAPPAPNADVPAVAPYSNNGNGAAPAPAPAPAPAEEDIDNTEQTPEQAGEGGL